MKLHQLPEHGLEIGQGGGTGIAGDTGVRGGGLAQEGQILLLQLLQFGGDADVHGGLGQGLRHRPHQRGREGDLGAVRGTGNPLRCIRKAPHAKGRSPSGAALSRPA